MQPIANFADQLFDLVVDIDPAKTSWEKLRRGAEEKCRKLSKDIDAILEQVRAVRSDLASKTLREVLEAVAANLSELAEALSNSSGAERWRQLYASLARNYDELVRALTEARVVDTQITFRRLSPFNYTRSLFHIAGGIAGALIYHYFLSRTSAALVMVTLVATFTLLEILRRGSASANDVLMRLPFFRRIARAREYYQLNSSTYYVYGMLIAVVLFPRQAVEGACLVLAVGDPLASAIGRRFSRPKIHADKSLAGTVAFLVTAFVAMLLFNLLVYTNQSFDRSLLVASVAAAVGAVAEAITIRLDDNLTVPLSVACALAFVVA